MPTHSVRLATKSSPRAAAVLSLSKLLSAACEIYPRSGLGSWKNRAVLVLGCLRHRSALSGLLARPGHEGLIQELASRPQTLGFTVWPYIHAAWPPMMRFGALAQHQQALRSDMAALAGGDAGMLVIADLSELHPGLHLAIDRAPWCLREGSLVFSLFLHDERMMTLSLSFGLHEGQRVVYVGGIQGAKVDDALDKYKSIGKALYGMRSRDFLIKAFQLLMHSLRVGRILCVAEASRHHHHPYFGSEKSEHLRLNYDQVWQEHAGTAIDGGFYELGTLPVERPLLEIAQKNRTLYRKRYEMMHKLEAGLAARFQVGAPVAGTSDPGALKTSITNGSHSC